MKSIIYYTTNKLDYNTNDHFCSLSGLCVSRKMGYEPGQIKMTLESFRHKPTGWKESTLDQII